jgi:hypothetical protein
MLRFSSSDIPSLFSRFPLLPFPDARSFGLAWALLLAAPRVAVVIANYLLLGLLLALHNPISQVKTAALKSLISEQKMEL